MALKLNFSVCQSSNCSTILFKDLTGEYNVLSNPTGWGKPNPDIADYHYAKIEIFLGTTLIQTIEFENSVFPAIDPNFEYNLNTTLADGLYTIVYTVQEDKNSGTIFSKKIYQAFYCNVECCVMSMISDIDLECGCSDNVIDRFNKAYALLKGLKYSAGCGNITSFNNILAQLQKICMNANCKNCK